MPVTINGTTGIQDALGSAASPSLTNTTATNTGLYFPTSTTLGLSTNGTAALTIDASQNVGIGTSSPTRLLTLYKTSAPILQLIDATSGTTANDGLLIQQSGVDTYIENAEIGFMQFRTSATERMRIDSSGNLLVNCTSSLGSAWQTIACTPSSGSKIPLTLQVGVNSDGFTAVGFNNQSGNQGSVSCDTAGIGLIASSTLRFTTNAAERMRIDSSGNVGIGTTSPAGKLDVTGDLYVNNAASAPTGGIYLGQSGYRASILWNVSTGNLDITPRSGFNTVFTGGNLLVGTTSYTNAPSVGVQINNASSSVGFVAIGHANGTTSGNYYASFAYNSTIIGTISQNGTTAVAYNTTSDYRLKENVQPMTTGLTTVSALKPVTYDWVSDKSAGEGFIAHELQSVIPLAVTGEKDAVDDEGNIQPQGVDYSKIVVHLVAAIQELKAELDALKATK